MLDDVQPLLAGPVRWAAAGATIDVGAEAVEVSGDVAWLQAVLGGCDGRTPVPALVAAHGPEARALVEQLLAGGALVDGEQAWRVLHRQSSPPAPLGRPTDAATLAALLVAPEPPAEAGLPLTPAPTAAATLGRARRSSGPADAPVPATFAGLSSVLAAAYALDGAPPAPGAGTVASAGALYPLLVHVLLREPLGPAAAGLWWHDPRTLRLHRRGDAPPAEPLFVPEPGCTALLARHQPVVFVSADLTRPSRKYGARAYRYGLLEAGAAQHAAALAATELGLPLRPIGGIEDDAARRALDLPDGAVVLFALLVGT